MPQSGLSDLCFAKPLCIHQRAFQRPTYNNWISRRRPRIRTLIFRVLAALLLGLFVLLCTSCLPLRLGSYFPHARRISIVRAPWSPAPAHNDGPTVDVPDPSPFATGKDCCIVLSALTGRGSGSPTHSQVMDQTRTANLNRRQNSSNEASEKSLRQKEHNSDAEHYELTVFSALRTMPDAHVFLLLESPAVVAFRAHFLRALTATLKDGSPRLHLVNLDLLDDHLRSRATFNASFGAVGRNDGGEGQELSLDRDLHVERELTLLESHVAFRDFLDHWPGVSSSCAQLLLLDSPLALLQHSPFHAYAGRVRPTPPLLGQSERSEAAASTQSGATSEREDQSAPLNEYLLFTEAHEPQHSYLRRVHSRESRGAPSERLEPAAKWWQWQLAERCLGPNPARVLFAGDEAQPPLLATGAILGTFAAVQRFVKLQGEQIMRLSATARSGSCLLAAARMESQTHKR